MSFVRFHAGEIDLELSGSESFIVRQLLLLAPFIGDVDTEALSDHDFTAPRPVAPVQPPEPEVVEEEPPATPVVQVLPPSSGNGEGEPEDELLGFYRSIRPSGRDRQADAALLFAYFLQRREGLESLRLGDLIRCCIRVGVDTRNFNRALGTLTRRGYLETVRHGHAYRISEHGVAAVESRL